MKKIKKTDKYVPEICHCCNQDTSYELALDRGTALIVREIAIFIQRKGLNCVHPRKEMEGVSLSSNQVGNLSRARFHGLIAKVKGNAGNYLLTAKGAKFLNNEPVARIAIIRKATISDPAHNIGYHMPETYIVTYRELISEPDMWVGIDYEILSGHVVEN